MGYAQEQITPYNTEESKKEQVEQMFDNIAPAYDPLNHLLSLGIDRHWRRTAIEWLKPFHPERILDIATGTGDFAILAGKELAPRELIGVDISEGMMQVARQKVEKAGLSDHIRFQQAAHLFLFICLKLLLIHSHADRAHMGKALFSQEIRRRLALCQAYRPFRPSVSQKQRIKHFAFQIISLCVFVIVRPVIDDRRLFHPCIQHPA